VMAQYLESGQVVVHLRPFLLSLEAVAPASTNYHKWYTGYDNQSIVFGSYFSEERAGTPAKAGEPARDVHLANAKNRY
jgi:hypothetical protein